MHMALWWNVNAIFGLIQHVSFWNLIHRETTAWVYVYPNLALVESAVSDIDRSILLA